MDRDIRKILQQVQNSAVNNLKNVKHLEKLYDTHDFESFYATFSTCLNAFIQEPFQSKCSKNVMTFLGLFIAHMTTFQDEPEMENFVHPLLDSVIREAVDRLRVYDDQNILCNYCTLLTNILLHIGDQVTLNADIADMIESSLLDVLNDQKWTVRHRAVLALQRLQDPSIVCPIITALLKVLGDSNYMVRKEVVQILAPNKITISHLKDRTTDQHPEVRRAAFKHIAEIDMKHFKIAHRQFILRAGFGEPSGATKATFLNYLLPKWLTNVNRSFTEFLKAIKVHVEVHMEPICTKLIQQFFKTEPVSDLINALPLNESRLISSESMSSNLAHYWNIVVTYFRQSEDLDEFLDQVIPELTIFCGYIENLMTISNPIGDEWENADFEYMLYHLFDIAEHFDLFEEMGRQALNTLVRNFLKQHRFGSRLLDKLLNIANKLSKNYGEFTNEIYGILLEIWQPMVELPPNAQDKADRDFKISKIKAEINILTGDLEDAVENMEHQLAQELTDKLALLRKELEELISQELPVYHVQSKKKQDAKTLSYCLDLVKGVLNKTEVRTLTPSLKICWEEFLKPLIDGYSDLEPEVEWRVFYCLAMYSFIDFELAKIYIQKLYFPMLSYKVVPNIEVNIIRGSFYVISDLIRFNRRDLFTETDQTQSDKSTNKKLLKTTDEMGELEALVQDHVTVDDLVNVFVGALDDEEEGIQNAGFVAISKLLLHGVLDSPNVVTRIILKWYCPATQKQLQAKLGDLLQSYVTDVKGSQEVIVKSVVPTLTYISEAPRSSPLSELNPDQVIRFLAAITNVNHAGLLNPHIELARILLQEISLRPAEPVSTYFARMLSSLNIARNDSPAVRELIVCATNILEKENLGKSLITHLKKFRNKLTGIISLIASHASRASSATLNAGTSNEPNKRLSPLIEENNESSDSPRKSPEPKKQKLQPSPDPENMGDLLKELVVVLGKSTADLDIIPSSQPEEAFSARTRNSSRRTTPVSSDSSTSTSSQEQRRSIRLSAMQVPQTNGKKLRKSKSTSGSSTTSDSERLTQNDSGRTTPVSDSSTSTPSQEQRRSIRLSAKKVMGPPQTKRKKLRKSKSTSGSSTASDRERLPLEQLYISRVEAAMNISDVASNRSCRLETVLSDTSSDECLGQNQRKSRRLVERRSRSFGNCGQSCARCGEDH